MTIKKASWRSNNMCVNQNVPNKVKQIPDLLSICLAFIYQFTINLFSFILSFQVCGTEICDLCIFLQSIFNCYSGLLHFTNWYLWDSDPSAYESRLSHSLAPLIPVKRWQFPEGGTLGFSLDPSNIQTSQHHLFSFLPSN